MTPRPSSTTSWGNNGGWEGRGSPNPRWDMGWVDFGRADRQRRHPDAGTVSVSASEPSAIPKLYDDARPSLKRGGAGGRRRLAGLLVSFATVNSVSSSPVRWDPIKRSPALSLLFGSY
ncbi:unnamed protein product [Clonostachys rhizophaga]|uniref:Uncharacterized protein n=1 Tax=Clonostachys rhizophaga TaxID=160324 RepID=A0A9N9VC86_9HYPO|nr:unnamed protein product [Clonostachys rhizophaga]